VKTIIFMIALAGTLSAGLLPEWEMAAIEAAWERNYPEGVPFQDDLEKVVIAIRKAENGGPGREFGILGVGADTYSSQAGWAVCTVVKNYYRWVQYKRDRVEPFVVFLGKRYCPVGAGNDPGGLNVHWVKNVSKFVRAQM